MWGSQVAFQKRKPLNEWLASLFGMDFRTGSWNCLLWENNTVTVRYTRSMMEVHFLKPEKYKEYMINGLKF